MTLNGRVAAVSGAGSGIGRGITVALAGAGANVVVNDVLEDGLDETLRLVREAGSRASPPSATSVGVRTSSASWTTPSARSAVST